MKHHFKEAGTHGMRLGLAVGGGIAMNELNSWLEKQPFAAKFAQYVPEITTAAAALAYIMIPHKDPKKPHMIKDALFGAIVVAGTESATTLLQKAMGKISGDIPLNLGMGRGMGFSSQLVPERFESGVLMVNGIPVR